MTIDLLLRRRWRYTHERISIILFFSFLFIIIIIIEICVIFDVTFGRYTALSAPRRYFIVYTRQLVPESYEPKYYELRASNRIVFFSLFFLTKTRWYNIIWFHHHHTASLDTAPVQEIFGETRVVVGAAIIGTCFDFLAYRPTTLSSRWNR